MEFQYDFGDNWRFYIILENLNCRLKKLSRIFRDSYKYGLGPTGRLKKILDRDYKH